jgi:hypothetical protein
VLKSLDVLIGLVVVILALSMTVTVVTQALTAIANSRGRHLRRGLADLLQQLDPGLTAAISKEIAGGLLTHPLVSGSRTPVGVDGKVAWFRTLTGGPRFGNVIHREEFTTLLMALAGGQGSTRLPEGARTALATALANNEVADPAGALATIRAFALDLERAQPALAHAARQNLAILHAAPSPLVARINSWFDQTMDRTSQRFTASTRALTFAGAFLVAFGLQVDTPSLMNRLAMDDQMRAAFVAQASAVAATAGTPPAGQQAAEQRYRAFLAEHGVIRLPSHDGYAEGFNSLSALFGMLVTALLLSLGAPFWYSMLGKLLQLRSALAFKDDTARAERQALDQPSASAPATPPAASAAAPAAAASTILAGERGDLAAVG